MDGLKINILSPSEVAKATGRGYEWALALCKAQGIQLSPKRWGITEERLREVLNGGH